MSSTNDFLVEIGVEELPPKSLLKLSQAFETSIAEQLHSLELKFSATKRYASPRRLAVLVSDLESRQPDKQVEALGPALKAAFDENGEPTPAALGFARKQGVDFGELSQVDTNKGSRLAFSKIETGAETTDLLEDIVNRALDSLPIAKRMRWGSRREEFVRPAHWILMLYGSSVVEASVLGLKAGSTTIGHRFHANVEIQVGEPSLYAEILKEKGQVEPDFDIRRDAVRQSLESAAESLSGTAVIENDLLDEVTALVEWPVALSGKFDDEFLQVPSEALISSMKEHQKYFHVVDADNSLLPFFITVSNIVSENPEAVINGNERVIRPRLADAAFFYETDLKTEFADFRSRLKPIVFQSKLGTVFEKTERVSSLAKTIAPLVGAEEGLAERAGSLCKNDLVSEMVSEFADLQGLMGRYYANASNEPAEVSEAMFEHYLPRFAGDRLPQTATGTAVALADRLDTLTGIFGIGQIPSGSKDPFALRRASLGVLRILIEGKFSVSLSDLVLAAHTQHKSFSADDETCQKQVNVLLEYMLDRFAAMFADEGIPTESFLAVRAIGLDNPLDIYNRTLAVTEFADSEHAPALAAANKRVSNILSKAEANSLQPDINPELLSEESETALFSALNKAKQDLDPLIDSGDYSAALFRLSALRNPIDTFFDNVMVMVEDAALRENRLALLSMLRGLFLSIADISLLPND